MPSVCLAISVCLSPFIHCLSQSLFLPALPLAISAVYLLCPLGNVSFPVALSRCFLLFYLLFSLFFSSSRLSISGHQEGCLVSLHPLRCLSSCSVLRCSSGLCVCRVWGSELMFFSLFYLCQRSHLCRGVSVLEKVLDETAARRFCRQHGKFEGRRCVSVSGNGCMGFQIAKGEQLSRNG